MKAPRRKRVVRGLGAPITIKTAPVEGGLGTWDDSTGTITLAPHLGPGRLPVLIHEAMHVVETMMVQGGVLKRRVPHAFIEGAAFALAHILVADGATKVDPKRWRAWVKAEAKRERER